ncbi:MAG: LacI family DNA-binding transcriptional regulator, partial [Pseudomonadota bacterium]
MRKGISQTTVAEQAGVSTMTVSRVLSKPEIVDEETKERVFAAIAKTGYAVQKRTRTVAVLVSSMHHSAFTPLIEGVSEVVTKEGYDIVLGNIGYSEDQEYRVIRTIIGRRPDGIVITSNPTSQKTRRLLKSSSIPIVEVWNVPEKSIDMAAGYSSEEAGRVAADYLLDKGYKHLAFFGTEFIRDISRWKGFSDQVSKRKGSPAEFIKLTSEDDVDHDFNMGYKFLDDWKDNASKIDAVYCSSDVLASAIVFEGLRRGMRFP